MKRSFRRHHRERVIAKRVRQVRDSYGWDPTSIGFILNRHGGPSRFANQSLSGECTCGVCKRARYRDTPRTNKTKMEV